MQMQPVQTSMEKVTISGDSSDGNAMLTATCHKCEINLAKQVLMTLYQGYPTSWHVEFQDSTMVMWSGLHQSYGYRMSIKEFGKGLHVVKKRGQELVERIKAGCAK